MRREWYIVVGVLVLAFVITLTAWVDRSNQTVYTAGQIESVDPANIVGLVNSIHQVTDTRYDSLHSPRGSTYTVDAGKTLVITSIDGGTSTKASKLEIHIGYASTAVTNSATAPSDAIIVFDAFIEQAIQDLDCACSIPAGMIPFMQVIDDTPGSTYNFHLIGVLRNN